MQDQNYELQYKYTDALEDAYCTENGEYYYYFRGTNTLRFFCRTLTFDGSYKKITKEEAANIAESFMKTILTEDCFSEYDVCHVSDLKDSLYSVSYEKCIHGVRTYDCPTVWITENGEIYAFNGHEMLSCLGLEESLSAEAVSNACQIYPIMRNRWKHKIGNTAILLFVRIMPEKRIYKFMFPIRIRTKCRMRRSFIRPFLNNCTHL